MSRGAQTPRASETITPRTLTAPPDGGNGELDRVREVDELPREVEALGDAPGQGLDADLLGRVVARGHEVDPQLARCVQGRLRRLAGQEQVVSGCGRFGQVAGASAGDHGGTLDPL